jgi:hypothetical protein
MKYKYFGKLFMKYIENICLFFSAMEAAWPYLIEKMGYP